MHTRDLLAITLVAGGLSACQHHARPWGVPAAQTDAQADAQGNPAPQAALPEDVQRVVQALSRLSPENTLAHLPRVAQPSAPVDSLRRAVLDIWSQPNVADGYVRSLIYDPAAHRFWIEETGGLAGWTHWYGPLVLSQSGVIQIAPD